MNTRPERLAILEQRLADHEARCEERLGEIKHASANTLKAVEGLKNRFWAIAVSLLAWAMAQVWAGNQTRLSHLETGHALAVQQVRAVIEAVPRRESLKRRAGGGYDLGVPE